MSTPAPRPPQVTSACLFVGVSCAILLYSLVGMLTSWNSLAVQEPLRDAFDQAGVALTEGRSESIRVLLQAVIVLLVAGLVCAFYTARRHRPSRVVVTGVAGVTALMFTGIGGILGLIPAAFAVYVIIQLWSAPARRWFAGEPEPTAASRVDPTTQPFVERHPGPDTIPPPPGGSPLTGAPKQVVTILRVVTSASLAATLLAAGFIGLWLGLRDDLATELSRQYADTLSMEVSATETRLVLDLLAGVSAVSIVLAAVAIWAARRLVQGRPGAGGLLLGLSIATMVLGVLVSPVGLLWTLLAVWVAVLLGRPETRSWATSASR